MSTPEISPRQASSGPDTPIESSLNSPHQFSALWLLLAGLFACVKNDA